MRDERADAELLSSGLASDFGCLYDRHVRAVTAFVGSWIGEPDVVFDLVAETFARALEHRLQYDASKGPAVAWLLGIARNLMIDSARRGQVESESRERLGMGRVELDDEQLKADRRPRGRRVAGRACLVGGCRAGGGDPPGRARGELSRDRRGSALFGAGGQKACLARARAVAGKSGGTMKDPFDILRAELVSAAERAALPAPRKRWGWLRRPSRPMAVLLAALVIAGAGGAAVVSLRSASQPLAGRVSGAITPASLAGYSYTIAVTPSLAAGTAGWESLIIYTRTGASIQPPQSGGTLVQPGPSGGTLGYPTATSPVFGGGTGPDSCPVCFARGNAVTYVLTGPQAFAVRIGSQTIRTITSPALPSGDRAAVVFIPAKGRVFLFPAHGPVPVLKPPPGIKNVFFVPVEPLARSGQSIAPRLTPSAGCSRAARGRCSESVYEAPPSTWMAPDALSRWWPLGEFTVPYQGPGYHAPTRPRPGVCELAQRGLPALHVQFGHTVAWIAPVPDALGEVFLSCVDAEYWMDGWPLQAAVLLDGHRPGQVLGPIPGARPVSGHPDMVNLPLGRVPLNYDAPISADSPQFSLTAKRVGNAWLVVQGGSGLAQRVQVLNALRINKLDLHHLTSGHATH